MSTLVSSLESIVLKVVTPDETESVTEVLDGDKDDRPVPDKKRQVLCIPHGSEFP